MPGRSLEDPVRRGLVAGFPLRKADRGFLPVRPLVGGVAVRAVDPAPEIQVVGKPHGLASHLLALAQGLLNAHPLLLPLPLVLPGLGGLLLPFLPGLAVALVLGSRRRGQRIAAHREQVRQVGVPCLPLHLHHPRVDRHRLLLQGVDHLQRCLQPSPLQIGQVARRAAPHQRLGVAVVAAPIQARPGPRRRQHWQPLDGHGPRRAGPGQLLGLLGGLHHWAAL